MPGSFGARLRQRREQQAVALTTIAEQTKIKLSLLEALERDDVSRWPSGIFRRAYIRAYAHAIGLDPDVVVREFLEVHPEPAEVVEPLWAGGLAAGGARTNPGPTTRLGHILGSATGFLSGLRRSGAVNDPVPAESVPVNAPHPAEPDSPAAAAPCPQPNRAGLTHPADDDRTASKTPAASDPDFMAVARLCTELGRVENATDVQRLLQEAAGILDAIGLIVWVWDPVAAALRPLLVHGYSDRVLAQLPAVKRDSENATAAAFRTAQTCVINGSDDASGALVVPLLNPMGCAGVLAIELQHGGERRTSVCAAATILAALLAQLIAVGGGDRA